MHINPKRFGAPALLATMLFAGGCEDALTPEASSPVSPVFSDDGAAAAVSGEGAINDTLALATRNRQEFEFDVTETPDGRLFVRDFSVVRSDGSLGTFTVDPTADPATTFTSFVQTSARCITFRGMGRVDTGDLFAFSAEACDNGSPGADADFFRITIPDVSYEKADTLTEGEIAASGLTKGDLDVTAVTTGSDLDPDGYTVTVDSTMSQTVGVNATVRFAALAEGSYSVELGGVAANCTVSGENPRVVTVVAGSVANTTFDVACTALDPSVTWVTGQGAIGSPLALPYQDRLEFDFEATSGLTGRAVVTDYSVVRDDGTVGQMTVDAATDPETGITSFSRTSAECVRFGGIGRLDFGALYQFFIDACDNASDGAGADTFNMTLPDRPYSNGGTLTEGDIAISTF